MRKPFLFLLGYAGPSDKGRKKSVFPTSWCGGVITPVETLLGSPALLAWGLVGPNCFRVLKMGLELMAMRWVGGPIARL